MPTLPAWRGTPFQIGLAIILVAVAAAIPLFLKAQIATLFTPGESLTVHFAADRVLDTYRTDAKVAGVPVGKVTAVAPEPGGAAVTVKISDDAYTALGSAPAAAIRPTTLLGGRYYVDLIPGGLPGDPDGDIPRARTRLPVELEQVAAALQPSARLGAQHAVAALDATLTSGGDTALRQLLAHAPSTLPPVGGVLTGLRGEHPATDLPDLVGNLESTARVLTDRQGQLAGTVTDLDAVGGVFDRRATDVAAALSTLPATLDSANTGLDALDITMHKLRDTAGPARDIVAPLHRLLDKADPVLDDARPLVSDLRTVLGDARPTVDDLVPAADDLTDMSENLSGPVLDRINGPIRQTVFSPFAGAGPYAGNGADFPFYKAVGYMASNLNRSARYTDPNGAVVSLQFGAGPGSLAGLPVSLVQMFEHLTQTAPAPPRPALPTPALPTPALSGPVLPGAGR
jgi:phospholipid/cholesterol/gamma-HCH transport system substrate-binding protein